MRTFEVTIDMVVRVTLDETKFDAAFMEEFNSTIFPAEDLLAHAGHLGSLFATGRASNGEFVEGYGPLPEMGISADASADVTYVEEVNDLREPD